MMSGYCIRALAIRNTPAFNCLKKNNTQMRCISLLHSGSRVSGLKRNPNDYLRVGNHQYGISEENLKGLQLFLGENYRLPDKLILQVLTHKSFAHGSVPYNEKLAVLGSQLLKFYSSIYAIKQKHPDNNSSNSIDGLNFQNLGTSFNKRIVSKEAIAEFAKENDLNKVFFFKKRDPLLGFQESGELSATNTLVHSLIAAVLLNHGKEKAEKFIEEKVLNGAKSLPSIVKKWDDAEV